MSRSKPPNSGCTLIWAHAHKWSHFTCRQLLSVQPPVSAPAQRIQAPHGHDGDGVERQHRQRPHRRKRAPRRAQEAHQQGGHCRGISHCVSVVLAMPGTTGSGEKGCEEQVRTARSVCAMFAWSLHEVPFNVSGSWAARICTLLLAKTVRTDSDGHFAAVGPGQVLHMHDLRRQARSTS